MLDAIQKLTNADSESIIELKSKNDPETKTGIKTKPFLTQCLGLMEIIKCLSID